MNEIKKHLQTVFNISEEEVDIFLSVFTKTTLKKNTVFLEQGQVCNKVALIEKGLLKCVYHKNGEEIVFEFSFENNFISDYYSFLTDTSSQKEIRCIENSTLYVTTKQHLEKLGNKYSFIESMSRKVNEKLFLTIHNRLKSKLLDTPTEQYQKLLLERPDLVSRIPQYLIASYLNVKPETISRIRKKITGQ